MAAEQQKQRQQHQQGAINAQDWTFALATSLLNIGHNWDGLRVYPATSSRKQRIEAWTEQFGTEPNCNAENSDNKTPPWHQYESKSAEFILASPYPVTTRATTSKTSTTTSNPTTSTLLTLVQYRPAWFEQFVLRALIQTPFCVVNSRYAVTEITGPLPYLCDYGSSSEQQSPFLVPRGYSSNMASSSFDNSNQNHAILRHLQTYHGLDLTVGLQQNNYNDDDNKLKQNSALFINLIETTLQTSLRILRYQDWHAWQQVYRSQSVEASKGYSNSRRRKWWFLLWPRTLPVFWQVWCERMHERAKLTRHERTISIQAAIQNARSAYQFLERQLASVAAAATSPDAASALSSSSYSPTQQQQELPKKKLYLLGTDQPTLADAYLWAHLANALTDVHLVVVLADCPNLCRYAQQIWDDYFTKPSTAPADWQVWNVEENARNAFCQIPMLSDKEKRNAQRKKRVFKKKNGGEEEDDTEEEEEDYYDDDDSVENSVGGLKHAVDLMEQLSLQSHFLLSGSMVIAKEIRTAQESYLPRYFYPPFSTWYRWDHRAPGASSSTGAGPATAAETEAEKKELQEHSEHQRNDFKWLAISFTATVGVWFFLREPLK